MDVLLSQCNRKDMSIWDAVDTLRVQLLRHERITDVREQCFEDAGVRSGGVEKTVFEDATTRDSVLRRIEHVIETILKSLARGDAPSLTYANRTTWDNVCYNERQRLEMSTSGSQTSVRFDSVMSVNKFALTLQVLQHIHGLLRNNTHSTKRDMFYHDPKAFGSQAILNDIVDNISCMLGVPRWHLHILSTSKGLVAGDLTFTDVDGTRIHCSQTATGITIPSHVTGITSIESDAKVVLLIEKDATFQRLMDDNICTKLGRMILITGKGFPDLSTRLLVRRLWDELRLPTLAIMDADPHGMEIMSVYRFGSMSLAFEAHNLTVPAIRWLGVWPSDIERMQIPKEVLLPLGRADIDKAQELLRRPYIGSQPLWRREIEILLQAQVKAEIQCLQSISPNFLCDVYIPNKLRYGGWL